MSSDGPAIALGLAAFIGLSMYFFGGNQNAPKRQNYEEKSQQGKQYISLKDDTFQLSDPFDFEKFNLDSNIPTVIFAKASWCSHCTRATPEVKKLFDELNINVIDADESNKEAHKFLNIKGFPTLYKVTKDGHIQPFKSAGFGPETIGSIKKFAET